MCLQQAANESKPDLEAALAGTDMVFVTVRLLVFQCCALDSALCDRLMKFISDVKKVLQHQLKRARSHCMAAS